jgi:kinesin family protein 15
MEDCSHEALMRNTEDILILQLELDILKSILAEERTSRGEVQERTTILGDELKAANLRILHSCKQSDAIGSELDDARSVIEALESQQILLINELDELKENNQQSIEILKRRDRQISRLNTELDNHRKQILLASAEPKMHLLKRSENEDSPLQRKLKRMQASLEKAQDLNIRYQKDQASDKFAEQEMDEVCRQVEVETTEVIMCLQEELISLQQQLDASNKNELLAKQSLNDLQLERKELNDRLLGMMKEKECFCKLTEEKEKKIQMLTNDWESLQEELLSLQQQLDASNKNEQLTKQSLGELQLESKQLNDRLLVAMKENQSFSALIEEKEKEIQLLTHDWDRLAADIESFLVNGNASLDEASDQVAFISESFSQRRWVEDQVQKMCQGIADREKLLEELQSRLKEADHIKCDLDLKLRSLRGAMEAINEMHQQERNDQEKSIALLRSQVSEHVQAKQQLLEDLRRVDLLLDESIATFVQKEVLEQNYVSSLKGMEGEIHHLETQLDDSKKLIAHSLSQAKDKEQTFEKLKSEENTVLLRMSSDVLKAKGIIREFGVGFNMLESSLSVDPEEVCQNSHLNLEDRVR